MYVFLSQMLQLGDRAGQELNASLSIISLISNNN